MTRILFFCSIPSLFFLIEFKTADLQPTTFEFNVTPHDACGPPPHADSLSSRSSHGGCLTFGSSAIDKTTKPRLHCRLPCLLIVRACPSHAALT